MDIKLEKFQNEKIYKLLNKKNKLNINNNFKSSYLKLNLYFKILFITKRYFFIKNHKFFRYCTINTIIIFQKKIMRIRIL